MVTTLGLEKVREVLARGSEPHLLTGEQYKASLRDGRRVIDHEGKEIEDVTAHPTLRRAAELMAKVHDLQFDPETRDIMTYVDPERGERYPIGWRVPRSKDDLRAKLRAMRAITLETLGMFGRPPDYGSMMAMGFLGVIDRIEKENPDFAENVRQFVKFSSEHNVYSTDLIADAQSDRRIPLPQKPGRLRIVEDRPDGIVLYGSKVAGSVGAIAHFFTLATVLGEGLAEDAAIWCAVPVNVKGLTLVLRGPVVDPDSDPEDNPLDCRGEELDNYLIFDHVFIPREYVFSVRNLSLLGLYFESTAHALWHILARLSVRAEIFAGTAQAIADILGSEKIPGVRNMVTEVTTYAAALRAFVLAAVEEAVDWNGVITPNPPLVTAGRLYSIDNYPRVMYVLRDMSGQGLVSRFPKAVWENPEFGEKLEEFLPGTGVTAREKNRFFNFVWDLTTGSHASRVGQFENVNATPRYFISELVYQHCDRSEMAKFVRRFAGISPEAHT